MNIAAITEDLKNLCAKHGIIMYADENDPCTVIEALLSMEEAEAGLKPEQFRFEFVTSETYNDY
jgi:hypothetical protein